MRNSGFWEYARWIIPFVCFCFAFSGIFARSIPWFPNRPFDFFSWPEDYLFGYSAIFVGIFYLVVGVVAIFSTYLGLFGFVGAFLLTWILGTFVQQRPNK